MVVTWPVALASESVVRLESDQSPWYKSPARRRGRVPPNLKPYGPSPQATRHVNLILKIALFNLIFAKILRINRVLQHPLSMASEMLSEIGGLGVAD